MTDFVFFYGTLMSPFERTGRQQLNALLEPIGFGWIQAALFDLGLYPAAVPAHDASVFGEVHRMRDSETVLTVLDEIEGYREDHPDTSLYRRVEVQVALEDGDAMRAWAYFYNAPLGKAQRIESGDYLRHLNVR